MDEKSFFSSFSPAYKQYIDSLSPLLTCLATFVTLDWIFLHYYPLLFYIMKIIFNFVTSFIYINRSDNDNNIMDNEVCRVFPAINMILLLVVFFMGLESLFSYGLQSIDFSFHWRNFPLNIFYELWHNLLCMMTWPIGIPSRNNHRNFIKEFACKA